MSKVKYTCTNCSFQSTKWMGKCPSCNEWNSFREERVAATVTSIIKKNNAKIVDEITIGEEFHIASGISEFDRVLNGGPVLGSLILIGGEPGIGKSTLVAEVLGRLASTHKILYVSGEESGEQIAERCKRIGVKGSNFFIYNETIWQNILEEIKNLNPNFLVIDSIQTMASLDITSAAGTVSQIREVTYQLLNHAKANNITCFIIGHITKDGNIAGPKILEHMVDTVIYFEGDSLGHYRILRSIKNRFGSTNEVGIFEMKDKGLIEVTNPSEYFLDECLEGSFGRSITCVLEGSRALFIEIQALVVENKYGNGNGRRTTQGIDTNRLSMIVAVMEKYFGLHLSFCDIYLNVVGGIKVLTRESDLSILASLLSSYRSKPIDHTILFLGEVGLTGEVRSIPQIEARLKEAQQLNYKTVITSYKLAKQYHASYKLKIIGIKRAIDLDSFI